MIFPFHKRCYVSNITIPLLVISHKSKIFWERKMFVLKFNSHLHAGGIEVWFLGFWFQMRNVFEVASESVKLRFVELPFDAQLQLISTGTEPEFES